LMSASRGIGVLEVQPRQLELLPSLGQKDIFRSLQLLPIREIKYQGMTSFKQSDVLERFRVMKVDLSVDAPFDPAKLPRARRAIKVLLDQSGRPLGRVGVRRRSA